MNASIATPSTNPAVIPPSVASHALHSLVASVLTDTGFDGADASVVLELERMTFELITAVHSLSTSYAAHANRLQPTAYDLLQACLDQGIDVPDLAQTAQTKLIRTNDPLPILPPPPPPPAMLLSDDDTSPPDTPLGPTASGSKRKHKLSSSHRTPLPPYAHPHAPPLPPAHSYRNTVNIKKEPLPPTPTLGEMDTKLKQTRLVETELGRLIEGTRVSAQKPRPKAKKPKKDKDKGKEKESGEVEGSGLPGVGQAVAMGGAPGPGPGPLPPVALVDVSMAEEKPLVPLGPDTYALQAMADAEGLGVVNYRRRTGRV